MAKLKLGFHFFRTPCRSLLMNLFESCLKLNVVLAAVVNLFQDFTSLCCWQSVLSCDWLLQTDKGLDVIVEMLADVNLDKDLELAGPSGCVAVSVPFFTVSDIFCLGMPSFKCLNLKISF